MGTKAESEVDQEPEDEYEVYLIEFPSIPALSNEWKGVIEKKRNTYLPNLTTQARLH